MTDNKPRDFYNTEAIRAFGMFIVMLFVLAVCLDISYYQAKVFDMQGSLSLAAMTGVEALPDIDQASKLSMSIANTFGMELTQDDIRFDPNSKWLEISKSGYYDTMFLKYVGVKRIPVHVNVFDFKPGI